MRPVFAWRLRSRVATLGRRTLIVGILNVTPDSFFDGGRFWDAAAAVEHGQRMLAEGADVIDVGGESTRPGASGGMDAGEELRRIMPVIEGLRRAAPDALLSVDTYRASVAQAVISAGAEIVNDVSGLSWDAAMPAALAQCGCGVVLMHTRGRPGEWRALPPLGGAVLDLVRRELRERAAAAENAGIARPRIVLDPGFGFGKILDDNYPLLARLGELHQLGFPLMAGTSRKSFIGGTVSRNGAPVPPEQRLHGTMATVAAAILQGVHLVRVHDVAAARETAAVCDAILQNGNEESGKLSS
jgi:dihydropteroate synthase